MGSRAVARARRRRLSGQSPLFEARHSPPSLTGLVVESRGAHAPPMSTIDLPADLFTSCLSPTDAATPARLQEALTRAAPGWHVEGYSSLDVHGYERLGHCKVTLLPVPLPVPVAHWGGLENDAILTEEEAGCWRVEWRGHELFVAHAEWRAGWDRVTRTWLLGPTEELARAFALDVFRATNDPGEAILVFHGSCWNRSRELWAATQPASFDDLVLAASLKDRIREDFRQFLAARESYEEVGVAWRRGALLLGPPGNGKTHCLRALVKELGIPSLYVQSVKAKYETEEANLKRVFDRARQLRPCALVFEDLDALVNDENRSFFLNQLDGFEKNVGLVVLATTNHPERIDPAIVERPSRFDRKYHFDLPEFEERRTYLAMWQRKLAARRAWSDAVTERLAAETAGFSFAYLKEIVISTLMRSVSSDRPFGELLEAERAALSAQMKSHPRPADTAGGPTDLEEEEEGEDG